MDLALIAVQSLTLVAIIVYVYKTWEIASATRDAAQAAKRSAEATLQSVEAARQAVAASQFAAEATARSAEISEHTLQEMRDARDQEVAPYVVAYFDVSEGRHIIRFVVENLGKSMARDVHLTIEPRFQTTKFDVNEVAVARDGIPALAPGQALRTFFDVTSDFFSTPDLPTQYRIIVTYTGGLHPAPRTTIQIADLNMYREVRPSPEKGMHQLVEEMEKICGALGKPR
jgi:hypothetical protein